MPISSARDLTDTQWEILDDLFLNHCVAKMDVADHGRIDVPS
jgi:hypothetical protein